MPTFSNWFPIMGAKKPKICLHLWGAGARAGAPPGGADRATTHRMTAEV
jgi:hypothetical protein